jgi:eukaryotic-like serine/threonine-protein kinase
MSAFAPRLRESQCMPQSIPSPPRPALTPEDWARVSVLFDSAVELPTSELAPFLAQLEQEQPTLTPWLRDLLDAHAARTQDDWLERGPSVKGDATNPHGGLSPGQRVGPWVLGAMLGSGGMATVWRANKADALPSREVALKLPLSHRAGSQLADRFVREQVILAKLAHPHIATLYDAGVADDGTPWLAMECVQGANIDRWCDARRLGVKARVQLFMQVLDAVQYAHSRLVIHRDLKPSNILVTGEGQVRLLDFGIAKLLADDNGVPEEATGLTQAAGQVMTPAYAAPEQLLRQPLTTATDIYALGVVLFELLAGARPYRLKRPALQTRAQLEVAVAEGQLRLASECATADAAQERGTTLRHLTRDLHGDLDTLLAKALHQEGKQRYASAAEFADDLQRWSQGEPVRAQRASGAYRLRRFVQRNRVPVAAAAVVLAALVGALVISLVQVQRADRERDEALAQRGRSLALSNFLMDQLMVVAQEGQPLTVPGMLSRAETNARQGFAGQPNELAEALFVIGAQRRNFDSGDAAGKTLAEAKRTAQDVNLRSLIACDEAMVMFSQGQRAAAIAQVQAAVGTAVAKGVKSLCLDYAVLLANAEGDLTGALQAAQQSVQLASAAPDVPRRAQERGRMIVAYLQAMTGAGGNPDPVFTRLQDSLRAAGTERSLTGIEMRSRWAAAGLASGDARLALRVMEENLAAVQDQAASPVLAGFLRTQAQALEALGQDAPALRQLRASWARAQAPGDAALQASTRCLAAPIALRLGDAAGAQQLLADGVATLPVSARVFSETARGCAMARAELALAAADIAGAQVALRPLLDEPKLPLQHRASALLLRARVALAGQDSNTALADADEALALSLKMQGSRIASFRTALAHALRGDVLAQRGDSDAARQAYAQAAGQFEGATDTTHPVRVKVQDKLAGR